MSGKNTDQVIYTGIYLNYLAPLQWAKIVFTPVFAAAANKEWGISVYVDLLTYVVVNPAWQSREWGLFVSCLLIGWPPLPVPPPPTPYNPDHPSVTSFATHSSQTVLQKYQSISQHICEYFFL